MLAYHNDPEIKAAIVATLEDHAAHDRIVKGQYWGNGKGCAVGCTIEGDDHSEYERRFGIPQALARLEDTIFERLPNEHAMAWPVRFMMAPRPGADLSRVQWQFLAFVADEALSRPEAASVRTACLPALDIVTRLARGEQIDVKDAESAAEAARSAARSAESAAESAAEAAEAARSAWEAAWEAARSAAESAAWAAAESAWAARSAAESAAWEAESAAWEAAAESAESAAESAESAESAAESAESAAWIRYADKLVELMAAA